MGRPALHLSDDIKPISDFRANAASLLKQVRDTGRPVVITQNGHSAAVLLDVQTYQELTDELETLREVAAARADRSAGRTAGHAEMMAQLRARVDRADK